MKLRKFCSPISITMIFQLMIIYLGIILKLPPFTLYSLPQIPGARMLAMMPSADLNCKANLPGAYLVK